MNANRLLVWALTLAAGAGAVWAGWLVFAPGADERDREQVQAAASRQPGPATSDTAASGASSDQASPGANEPSGPAEPQAPAVPVQTQAPLLGLPPVQFDPAVLDLGVIKPGESTSGVITLHNVSDKRLIIRHTSASCSCTSVTLSNVELAPGQALPIDVAYRATGTMGDKTAAVRVLFDGYDVLELPIKALVALAVRASPTFIDALQSSDGSQTLTGTFGVFSMDQKPFRVLAMNGKPPQFVNFDPATDQPRDNYTLAWDLSSYDPGTCRNAEGEPMPGWVVVETDHPGAPIFDLEVRHNCNLRRFTPMDTWALQDKRVLIGQVKPGEPVEVQAEVKWIPRRTRQEPPRAVVTDSTLFTAELVSVEPEGADGMMMRLRITPSPDATGLIYGTVRVHSNRQYAPLTVIGTAR